MVTRVGITIRASQVVRPPGRPFRTGLDHRIPGRPQWRVGMDLSLAPA